MLSVSARQFHRLLVENHELAEEARVVLGARAVRYRVSAIKAFAEKFIGLPPIQAPECVRRRRDEGRIQRDPAAAWIGSANGDPQRTLTNIKG